MVFTKFGHVFRTGSDYYSAQSAPHVTWCVLTIRLRHAVHSVRHNCKEIFFNDTFGGKKRIRKKVRNTCMQCLAMKLN